MCQGLWVLMQFGLSLTENLGVCGAQTWCLPGFLSPRERLPDAVEMTAASAVRMELGWAARGLPGP